MNLINSIIKNKTKCFFISPHLDDAVFSAGGLMLRLKGKTRINVVNVFTNAGDGRNTISARKYLRQCGIKDSLKLYKTRIAEDKLALSKIHAKIYNLGFTDALWRKKNNYGKFRSIIAKYIPELDRIYPIYRFNIIGKIAKEEIGLITKIAKRIRAVIGKTNNFKVFCPAGFGSHVDHLIARKACLTLPANKLIYWSDFPYCLEPEKKNNFISINKLKKYSLNVSSNRKIDICKAYATQFKNIFKDKKILSKVEVYYLSNL